MNFVAILIILIIIILIEYTYIFFKSGTIEWGTWEGSMWAAIVGGVIIGTITYFGFKYYEKLGQEKNKTIEHENEKKNLSAKLLSEIKVNQKALYPLYNSVNKVLDEYIEAFGKEKLPDRLIFESRIYSASLNQLGLFEKETRDKVVAYYSKLKYIEEEYKLLDKVHGDTYSTLVYRQTKYEFNYRYGKPDTSQPPWKEIEKFLRHAKKVYECGEELIKKLSMP